MSSQKPANYSVAPSTSYIITFLVFALLFDIGIFSIVYFLIDPIIQSSVNPTLYSKVLWSIMAFVFFAVFAIVYVIINSKRYWIGEDSIEVINVYRPKRRRIIKYADITEVSIRTFPIVSKRFDFGTIVFYALNKKEQNKIIAKFLGIKFPKEIYLEIIEKIKPEEKGKKKTAEDILL